MGNCSSTESKNQKPISVKDHTPKQPSIVTFDFDSIKGQRVALSEAAKLDTNKPKIVAPPPTPRTTTSSNR